MKKTLQQYRQEADKVCTSMSPAQKDKWAKESFDTHVGGHVKLVAAEPPVVKHEHKDVINWSDWVKLILLIVILLILLIKPSHGQDQSRDMHFQGVVNNGNCVKIVNKLTLQDSGSPCGGAGGSPGGSNTQIQFNDSGSFNGSSVGTYIKGSTQFNFQVGTHFQLLDPSDTTKVVQVDASNIATGTVRQFKLPNADSFGVVSQTCTNQVITSITLGTTACNTLGKAYLPATVVYTDQANTYSSGNQDFTGVTPLVPTQGATDNSTKAASTAYVTTAIANAIAAVNPAVAVQAATAAILPNSPTFTHVDSGIGSFITTLTLNTALVVDGYTPVLNDRILVKNEASGGGLGASKNGVYLVTQVSGVGLAWILTRALDYDQPSDMNNTGAIPVVNGTANAQTQWLLTSSVATVDTDALTFTQFSYAPSSIITTSTSAGGALGGTYPNPTLVTKYSTLTCDTGLGDGLNAMAAGTYLQSTCRNETGATLTISAIRCFTDNNGTSTLNATNDGGTGLLTGAVTCTNSYANGTQSGTTTLASGGYFKFTFVADGTSKQTDWVVVTTR